MDFTDDNNPAQPFSPLAGDGYKSRRAKRDRNPETVESSLQRELVERRIRLQEHRMAFREAVKIRVCGGVSATGFIEAADITQQTVLWVPTRVIQDDAFHACGRELRVKALRRARHDDPARYDLLLKFIGNIEAITALTEHGILPQGLITDHYNHPLRGGGKARVGNVSFMTCLARDILKNKLIWPSVNNAYELTRRDDSHTDLEAEAASYLADGFPVPRYLKRELAIGAPRGVIMLTQADFDLRAMQAANHREANALQDGQLLLKRAQQKAQRPARQATRPPTAHRS